MADNQVEKPASQGPSTSEAQQISPVSTLELNVAGQTDVGQARPHNEDYVDYYIPRTTRQLTRKGSIFLVADGMGGHRAGEVASQGAVRAVIERYYQEAGRDVPSSLIRAFRGANEQLYRQAQADPTKSGMGTTLVAAVVLGRKLYVANVGDSRAYLVNRQGITQITEDHSWVEEQVRAGLLTEEQARRHPHRNLVTRALGSKPSVEVDIFVGEIGPGDRLLLCSDGLTNWVSDDEISAIARRHAPDEATRLLVAEANERGGKDNITVLIVSAQKELAAGWALAHQASAGMEAGRSLPVGRILAGLAILLLALLASLYAWRSFGAGPTRETPTRPAASPSSAAAVTPLDARADATGELATATSSAAAPPSPRTGAAGSPAPPPTGQVAAPEATETDLNPALTVTPDLPEAPVTLGSPEIGERLAGVVTFTWIHHGSLEPAEAFQLLIWRADQESSPLHVSQPLRQESYQQDLDSLLSPETAEDEYLWSVRIVSAKDGQRLTDRAPHRSFIYRRTGG